MPKHKISFEQREQLRALYDAGHHAEAKALCVQLGVTPFYATVLAKRAREPVRPIRRKKITTTV